MIINIEKIAVTKTEFLGIIFHTDIRIRIKYLKQLQNIVTLVVYQLVSKSKFFYLYIINVTI